MEIEQAMAYKDEMMAQGYLSDGCTMAPDFNFKECCQMHDFLRRFSKIPAPDADLLLRECIESKGHKVLAFIYYILVVIARKTGFYK